MPRTRKASPAKPDTSNSASLGFEYGPGQPADRLRGSMDAAEHKHVVLKMFSLMPISNAF